MSYAIIKTGGKQFVVEKGSDPSGAVTWKPKSGQSVELEAVGPRRGAETRVGSTLGEGAVVTATVVDHGRAAKIVVFKKKRRKHYKRKQGHRQGYTTLRLIRLDRRLIIDSLTH